MLADYIFAFPLISTIFNGFSMVTLRLYLVCFLVWCCVKKDFLRRVVVTLPRDIRGIVALLNIQLAISTASFFNTSIDQLFDRTVAKHRAKAAVQLVDDGSRLTFDQLQRLSWRIANYFAGQTDLHSGDVVAVFMHNCIEYPAVLIGLARLDIIPAQINFNLRLSSLAHCVRVANAKRLVVDESLLPHVEEVIEKKLIPSGLSVLVYRKQLPPAGSSLRHADLRLALQSVSDRPPAKYVRRAGYKSVLCYIYTSGTTGMPKAAKITHARYMMMATGVAVSFKIRRDDRIYITLPLYHTAGGIIGMGQALLRGNTIVIRSRFSAREFWKDCIETNCTVALYIGELCRYLLAQPATKDDRQHQVRMMYGNGLRPQIWTQFVDRFGIAQICELYGSTEGNTSILNIDNTVGSCGFITIYEWMTPLYPIGLVKVDERSGKLLRGADGLCIRCRPGDIGELVGTIVRGNPVKDFSGYVSEKETQRKVERDVFRRGDVVFRSGDILRLDEYGYLYFKDRKGDSFRWKGENVSSTEVEGIIQKTSGLCDAIVYGVEVPGHEGRAGMAAIATDDCQLQLNDLAQKLNVCLPRYAVPLFVRCCRQVSRTGTFKLIKTDLQAEGYDLNKCAPDQLFYLNSVTGTYEPLDQKMYQTILDEKMRF